MPGLSRGLVTERDRAAVGFVAAHPWVVSEQVRRFLSLASRHESRHVAAQVARRRLVVLVSHGLLAHGLLRLFGRPLSAYWLTRRGALFLDQDIAPGGLDIRQLAHDAAVADLHLALLSQGAQDVWTARTLASARARGALPDGLLAPLGGRHVHLPDLVARLADGRRVAFEVEMSRKAPRRLAEIMRAYRLARGLDAVAYLTPGEARTRALAEAARGVSKVSVSRLVAWSARGERSVPADFVAAQVGLGLSLLPWHNPPTDESLHAWLASVWPLAFGLGPALALAAAWKISRRPLTDRVPTAVASQARGGPPHPAAGVSLGLSLVGKAVVLGPRELGAHTLVAGATSAGKSTLVKRYAEGLSQLGHAVLVIDGKADPGLATFLGDLDRAAKVWLPGRARAPLNLLGGSPSQFAAKLIDVHNWTEPHYRAINHRYALQVGTYFGLSGEARTPANVLRLLVPENLDAAADALATRLRGSGDPVGEEAALAITTYTADLLKDPPRRLVVSGLADRFAGVVEGDLAGSLDDVPGVVLLGSILDRPGLWYLGLPGDTMRDEVAALGAWLLLELARVAHQRRATRAQKPQAHVVVEELSAFGHGALHLHRLLARARDAGIAVTVTTQALADVAAISDTLPDQMLANTGVQVFLHMRDREADWAASALGRGESEQQTWSEDSDGGVVRRWHRATTAPLVPARVLEGFGVGDAVLAVAATVTGAERRLERFRVALPVHGSHPEWRRPAWVARMLAVASGVLAAGVVLVGSRLSLPAPPDAALAPARASAIVRLPTIPLTPTATPPAPTPVQSAGRWRVGNTDHQGVYVRAAPDGQPLRAWPDGTPLEAAGGQSIGNDGQTWYRVRAPDGGIGWVRQRYLLPEGAPPHAP